MQILGSASLAGRKRMWLSSSRGRGTSPTSSYQFYEPARPNNASIFPAFVMSRARIPRIRRVTFMHAPPAGLGAFYARREMRRRRDSKFAAVSRQNNTMRRVILNVLEINSESAIRFYSFRYIEDSG